MPNPASQKAPIQLNGFYSGLISASLSARLFFHPMIIWKRTLIILVIDRESKINF